MKRRNFLVLALANAAWVLFTGCHRGAVNRATGADLSAQADQSKSNELEQVIAYEHQNRAQLNAALQKENEGRRIAASAAKTKDYRRVLQVSRAGAWSSFVDPRRQTFLALRERAAEASSKTVPCTLCDGRGKQHFCLLCNNSGKCPTCNGTGTDNSFELCPTCQGKKKCFLCFGSGEMPCPFCDDGLVYAQQPIPPDKPPIN